MRENIKMNWPFIEEYVAGVASCWVDDQERAILWTKMIILTLLARLVW